MSPSPYGAKLSYCDKAPTVNVYAPKKHQSAKAQRVVCFGFLTLEFGISLDIGAQDLDSEI